MARKTNNTKSNSKNKKAWYESEYIKELAEETKVELMGKVTKVFFENDKVIKFGFEAINVTSKGNIARTWLTVTTFEDTEINEDDKLFIKGYLSSSQYKGDWTLGVVANEIDVIE